MPQYSIKYIKIGKKSFSDFPKKPIILTFDDGYENNLTLAIPLLKKYNFCNYHTSRSYNQPAYNDWN